MSKWQAIWHEETRAVASEKKYRCLVASTKLCLWRDVQGWKIEIYKIKSVGKQESLALACLYIYSLLGTSQKKSYKKG